MLRRVRASAQKGVGDVGSSGTVEQKAAFKAKLEALAADGTLSRSHSFDSADAAAKSVLGVTAPLSAEYGLEVSGSISLYKKKLRKRHHMLLNASLPVSFKSKKAFNGRVVLDYKLTNL